MKISVIIPAYNAESTITETIQSVLNQTCRPAEVIVVNDGSKDQTVEAVKRFGDEVILIDQPNQGVSAARNSGIMAANSDWVAFLDADDTWEPEKLERQLELLNLHPELDWCATRYWVCGRQKKLSSYSDAFKQGGSPQHCIDALEAISTTVNIWVSTVLIKKAVVVKAGMFCPELSSTADNDLWIRVAPNSRTIGFVDVPLANYRLDPHSMSASAARSIAASRFVFFDRLAAHIQDSAPETRPYFERIFDRYVGNYMFNVARAGNVRESRQLFQWLRDRNYRIPALKYRWIQWLPQGLIGWLRRLRSKA